jgi:hypothetical protein
MSDSYPALLRGSGMTRRRWITIGGVIVIALLLAFPLQDVIRKTVIVPLAYIWWAIGVLYQSFPQVVVWILLVILVAFTLISSLTTNTKRFKREEPKTKPSLGKVENLADGLDKMRHGTYYKWQVAHRLGRLARDFLILRGDRANTKDLSPLTGRDWHPSQPVDDYLDTGLHGSFADFPTSRVPFKQPEPTPLDLDVKEAVVFLEGQIKTNST